MRFEFKPSFERSLKSLSPAEKAEVKSLCMFLIDTLSAKNSVSKGMGLKNLQGDFWEIRKGLRLRILFRMGKGLVQFVLAGSHDHIRKQLRNSG